MAQRICVIHWEQMTKKARLSRWTYMTHHITSHWAHMTQRTHLIHEHT